MGTARDVEEKRLRYLGTYEAWGEYKHLSPVLTGIFREAIATGNFRKALLEHADRLHTLFDRVMTDSAKYAPTPVGTSTSASLSIRTVNHSSALISRGRSATQRLRLGSSHAGERSGGDA